MNDLDRGGISGLAEEIFARAVGRTLDESPRFFRGRLIVVLERDDQRDRVVLLLSQPAVEPPPQIQGKSRGAAKR